jgi:hypothetical protein
MPLLLLLLTLSPIIIAGNICYLPNGDTATDVPCDPSAEHTQCCWSHGACLTNGLCALSATNSTGISYVRGTCTDKTWSSPLCPQQCQLNQDTAFNSSAYDFRKGGVQIWQCGSQGYAKEAEYCCESAAESQRCCETQTAVFTLGAARVGASTGVVTSTAGKVDIESTITAFEPKETGAGREASATPTAAVAKKDKKMLGVDVGVGVGVAFSIVLAIVAVCICRKRLGAQPGGAAPPNWSMEDSSVNHTAIEIEDKHRFELATQATELPSHPEPAIELPGHGR